MKTLQNYGILIPNLLLPVTADLKTWSVIACDQFTQDHAYWQKAAAATNGNPSTLNLILPEVYLNDNDKQERITQIKKTMKNYLDTNVFAPEEKECIYIERKTSYGRTRHGLVIAVDLDRYEWQPGNKALIRATEATVPERIPPRMEIRTDAPLELPHIMLLANDPDDVLIGKTGAFVKKENPTPVYDGDLMMNSGHISGWKVSSDKAIKLIENAIEKLFKEGTLEDGNTFLFAVGDGNHSLATAKAVWEEYKKHSGKSIEELMNHPARYALVEIVNIYDSGLTFEPIHRVLFNTEPDMLIAFIQAHLGGTLTLCADEKELELKVAEKVSGARFGFVYTTENKNTHYEIIETTIADMAISRLQPVLDDFISMQNDVSSKADSTSAKKIEIDYIHGSEEILRLGKNGNAIGILLPPIAKDSFFTTINNRGILPRKSFSMGEASEKRFYLESRKLFS